MSDSLDLAGIADDWNRLLTKHGIPADRHDRTLGAIAQRCHGYANACRCESCVARERQGGVTSLRPRARQPWEPRPPRARAA